MEIPLPAPPRSASERVMLEAWLDFHRITLERKCSGLVLRFRNNDQVAQDVIQSSGK